jgi:hypothetical protein
MGRLLRSAFAAGVLTLMAYGQVGASSPVATPRASAGTSPASPS